MSKDLKLALGTTVAALAMIAVFGFISALY